MLTDVAGSSQWFDGGVVAYSNAAKTELLGVPARRARGARRRVRRNRARDGRRRAAGVSPRTSPSPSAASPAPAAARRTSPSAPCISRGPRRAASRRRGASSRAAASPCAARPSRSRSSGSSSSSGTMSDTPDEPRAGARSAPRVLRAVARRRHARGDLARDARRRARERRPADREGSACTSRSRSWASSRPPGSTSRGSVPPISRRARSSSRSTRSASGPSRRSCGSRRQRAARGARRARGARSGMRSPSAASAARSAPTGRTSRSRGARERSTRAVEPVRLAVRDLALVESFPDGRNVHYEVLERWPL